MKRKKINRFDILVENLIHEFSKIPNFDLTQTDKVANQIFNRITFRIAEVSSYKELVCSHFIPATNKAIVDAKRDFQNSKYKGLLKTTDLDFKETLHDTIRLSYVGLFHKLENYINDVVEITELIFNDLMETEGAIVKWAQDKFNFKIKDWRRFYITHKINWVANCVKHKDGLPVKEPIPVGFRHLSKNERIILSKDEFKDDCQSLIEFYPMYLRIMFVFAQHKMVFEEPINEEDYKHSPDLYQKQLATRDEMEKKIHDFINLLKPLE